MTDLTERALHDMIVKIVKIAQMQQPMGATPKKLIMSASQVELAKRILKQEQQKDWEKEVDFGDN